MFEAIDTLDFVTTAIAPYSVCKSPCISLASACCHHFPHSQHLNMLEQLLHARIDAYACLTKIYMLFYRNTRTSCLAYSHGFTHTHTHIYIYISAQYQVMHAIPACPHGYTWQHSMQSCIS